MLAKMQGITEAEMKRIFRSKKVLTLKDEVKVLEEITEETATNGGCQNGVHCGEQYEQIGENQLLEYLRDGWAVAYKLENEEVIVKR